MQTKSFLRFDNISFTYSKQEKPVFSRFNAELPGGFVSLIGPNASGKSTFMLLASGRLKPQSGIVLLLGENPAVLPQAKRNSLASLIYQNMEFETSDKTGSLLEQVFANGSLGAKKTAKHDNNLLNEAIKVFYLEKVLNRPLKALSKGEMQRSLLAFAVLYGSRSLFMDEPLFAMEQSHKEAALEYLVHYSKTRSVPIYLAMHELELSRKYAENILLFYPNRNIDLGHPQEVLTKEALELSYGVPLAMLKDAENLSRKNLLET